MLLHIRTHTHAHTHALRYGMSGMWDVWDHDMRCVGYGDVWDVWDMGCVRYRDMGDVGCVALSSEPSALSSEPSALSSGPSALSPQL